MWSKWFIGDPSHFWNSTASIACEYCECIACLRVNYQEDRCNFKMTTSRFGLVLLRRFYLKFWVKLTLKVFHRSIHNCFFRVSGSTGPAPLASFKLWASHPGFRMLLLSLLNLRWFAGETIADFKSLSTPLRKVHLHLGIWIALSLQPCNLFFLRIN